MHEPPDILHLRSIRPAEILPKGTLISSVFEVALGLKGLLFSSPFLIVTFLPPTRQANTSQGTIQYCLIL